jgi:hypothetical protein
MPLLIDIPDNAWSSQNVSLGGSTYRLELKYNNRDSRWRLSLSQGGVSILTGVALMENQNLLYRYDLDLFNHGTLQCNRVKKDGKLLGRDNLGVGKSYELTYYSFTELAAVV